MNSIQDALKGLHGCDGIKGAAVVTLDGLVAAGELDERFQSDVVGGLASFLVMTMNRSLREGGLGDCKQFLLHATHGKVVLAALGESYLVVIFDQFADTQKVRGEVDKVAAKLRELSRLGSAS